ncbi:MAG: hemerythrin domain-containing protein [Alphaproteobacteria bacterium]|nr:hemerythrin domain-containing protein [Alphaproteobacteria bacterium]
MRAFDHSRRGLVTAGVLGFAGLMAGCSGEDAKEVGAVEDLMREHGILRRVLLIYAESVPKLRTDAASVLATHLNKAAQLFRDFGEDYHERKLEEAYIFPRIEKAGGPAAGLVDPLLKQHQRGREITQFILGATASGTVSAADAEPLARAFEAFVRMYQNHTAREDTVIFPAWKNALPASEIEEMGDKFEEIEKAQFGGDGFDAAVKQVDGIEHALGFADLAQFTAPPPPRAGTSPAKGGNATAKVPLSSPLPPSWIP